MGAPIPEMEPVENASAEALLSALPTITATERRKHASVFNYWLSIRGDRQFPPIRDLDPLEISDVGPWSVLLEMIGGGEDAVVRHLGKAVRADVDVERISEAPNPSLLSFIHGKLPTVAATGQAFAFEKSFGTDEGTRRCWVTLLPFSENGTWIDYVYGCVSLDPAPGAVEEDPGDEEPQIVENLQDSAEEAPEPFKVPLRPFFEDPESTEEAAVPVEVELEAVEPVPEPEPEPVEQTGEAVPDDEPEPEIEPETVDSEFEPAVDDEPEPQSESELEPEPEPVPTSNTSPSKPGFSAKLLDSLASVGFYGRVVEEQPNVPEQAVTEAEPMEPTCDAEGTLQNKLAEVRTKADEARMAKLRSVTALYEGLSAAYDFALDAEREPEEYLKLVEAQGLKIQLRSPMKPVVKLAFDGTCDDETIAELEAVLAWALKMELPHGSLADRIEAEGGIEPILEGLGYAA